MKLKKERTFRNWFIWNLRGRPYELIIETGGIGHDGKLIEHNVFVADYLVDEYWRMRIPSHPHHYKMSG